jgi:hypothetical protein
VWPSPSRLPTERAATALVLGLMLLLTACVEPDPPGVGVQKLAADIVFGVTLPSADTPPANLAPGAAGQGDAVTYVPPVSPLAGRLPDIPAPRAPRPPNSRLPRPTPLSSPKSPCPPAALTAFPAQEAGLTVAGRPAEGLYRWKRTGTQTVATLPGVKLPIDGFEQRLVRNVIKVSDTEYTFETIQPELAGGITTISTFKVKTDTVSRSVTPPVTVPDPNQSLPVNPPAPPPALPPGTPGVPSPPGRVRAGDPERGISLMKLQRVDAQGNSSELTFSPAVLYFPLQVEPGEEFTSVGIDPRTGSVLQHRGRVMRHERVDACGEIVDGWAVESTQTFSGSAQTSPPRTYRYIVAPQLGGIIVSEEIHVTSPQGQTDAVFSLGQLQPTPLPAEARK